MLKGTPAVSPTTTSVSKPRKPRRTNLRLKTTPSIGADTRPTITTPGYPTPAWGPSYYKPRPGFSRTLQELRESIGNDQNTSYILGDLLDARYGKMDDIRERYFQEQRYEAEHEYNLADVYAREGIEYEPDLPDIDGIPKGEGPNALMRQLMKQIAQHPGDQKYAEGITRVYQDRIEDAEDIKNDIRDYDNSVKGYQQGHENYLEELAARESVKNPPDEKTGLKYPETGIPVISQFLDMLEPERVQRRQVRGIGDYLSGSLGRAVGDTGLTNYREPSMGEKAHGVANALPGVGKIIPDDPPDFLRYIGDESADKLWWTLDKLTRPLQGTATGVDTYAGLDEDERSEKKGPLDALLSSNLLGVNPLKSLDEFVTEPWKPAQGFVEGLTNGGTGNTEDYTLFGDVIANEAKRNPGKDLYDNKQYQLWAGLTADIIADPLNFMGVGLVRTPLTKTHQGLDQIAKANRIKQDAKKIGKFFDETEPMEGMADEVFTPDQIKMMLLGRGEQPIDHQSRIHNMGIIQENAERIVEAMARRQPRKGADAADLAALQAQMVTRRNQIINESANYSYFDDLARDLGISKRKGEPVGDIDEDITTLALAQKFEMGMRYERRMDDIAKEKFGIVDEFGDGDGLALEAHYEAMVEQFRRGGLSQKNLDSFRNSIDDALDDDSLAAYDINEWMGASWRADPRWSDLEARQMLRQADRLARKDKGRRKAVSAEESIAAGIRKLEGDLEFYKKQGWNIQPLLRAIEDSKISLNFAQKQSHLRRADVMMRLMKANINFKAGQKTYKNPAEAMELMKARDKINELKSKIQIQHGGNTGDSNIEALATKDTIPLGEIPGDAPLLNAEGKFDEDLLNPAANFKDQAHQLDWLSKRIHHELRGMQYHPDRPFNVEKAKQRLLGEVPAYFNGDEGFEFERLQSHFNINPKNGTVTLRQTDDPEVDQWLTDLKSIFEQEYAVNWRSRYQAKNRRRNEAKQGKVAEEKLKVSPEGEKILSMFKTKDGEVGQAAFGSKGLFPFVSLDGQPLHQGKEWNRLVTPTAGDRQTSVAVNKLIDELKYTTEEARHQAVGRLRDKLHEANYSVPHSPTKAVPWIVNHDKSIREAFTPENVAFRRLFKEQHGITMRDAIRQRDEALGLTVGKGMHPNSTWRKRYPHGVTKNDFLSGMTNTWDELHRMTSGGPFHVKIGNYKSEKQAREAGDNMEEWSKEVFKRLMRMETGARSKLLGRIYDVSLKAQARTNKVTDDLPKAAAEIEKKKLTSSDYEEIREKATKDTWKYIRNDIEKATLPIEIENQSLRLMPSMDSYSTPTELHQVMKYRLGAEEADLKFQRGIALKNKDQAEIARLNDELKALEVRKSKMDAQHAKRMEQVVKTREHIKKHLREDGYLRMAGLETARMQKGLTFNMLGEAFTIPGTKALFRATDEAANTIPLVKGIRKVTADLFRSPASQLEASAQLARARALGATPIIIENDVKKIKHIFSGMPQNRRERTMKLWLQNADMDTPEALSLNEAFDATFMEHFQNKVKIGDSYLGLEEINKYLPAYMKMDTRKVHKFDTPQQLIKHLQRNNADGATLKDPARLAWELRIGYHVAAARKTLDQTVMRAFGVKKLRSEEPGHQGVQGLQRLGWREVDGLDGYLFHPESVNQIHALHQMLEPHNIEQLGRVIDRATGYWKTMTTVYNPGYWTRNGVGEIMSAWLGGVNGWKPYKKSANVIGYARGDGKELDVLKQQFSFMNYTPTNSIKGNETLGFTRGGHKLTPENVWVLYNDRALKTGFFNTEYDNQFSTLGNKFRGAPVTEQTAKVHEGFRSTGEWYEDYFRVAHFIDALEKSPAKSIQAAADEAAAQVRKYHFDYTDFTNFEKTVMLRAFPFYKWTRKALPLMMTMLFQKPGKVMAYPKVTNTLSNSISSGDIAGDDNGFAPNYEGIVPGWIQDLWAYQIGESGPEDEFGQQNEQYFNLATPQMDSYKALTNPLNTAYGLLNPLFKVPDQQVVEQVFDRTNPEGDIHSLGDIMNGEGNYQFGKGDNEGDNSYQLDALKSILKSTPQTNMIQKPLGKNAEWSHEDWWTFLTGLGIYDSDTDRRRGEAFK